MIHLDTSFIVDLQRDTADRDAATNFLAEHSAEPLVISVHALCELEAGLLLTRHPERERARLDGLIVGMAIAHPDDQFVEVYGRTFVALERLGKRMPAMDLLIATAALVDKSALVTRNIEDFEMVPDLEVLTY